MTLLPLTTLPPRRFETDRLVLRAVEEEDAVLLFDLYACDPIATKYMSFKCTGRLEDTANYVSGCVRYSRGEESPIRNYQWVIIEKQSNQPIGGVGYGPTNETTLSGGYILNQRWWRKGYAAEAFKCIVDWAKTQSGVLRIEATHHSENTASGKVLAKSGLSFEGIAKSHVVYPNIDSEPQDSAMYAWTRK